MLDYRKCEFYLELENFNDTSILKQVSKYRWRQSSCNSFHAFSDSDVTSSFAMKGKQTVWNVWKSFPEATKAFHYLHFCSPTVQQSILSDEIFQTLEKFVVLLYNKGAQDFSVNYTRKLLCSTKTPTLQTSLQQKRHWGSIACARCIRQGRFGTKPARLAEIFRPQKDGWTMTMAEGNWTPIWSSVPSIWAAWRELVKCSCNSRCKVRCSCLKAKIPYIILCTRYTSGTQVCANEYQ